MFEKSGSIPRSEPPHTLHTLLRVIDATKTPTIMINSQNLFASEIVTETQPHDNLIQ
jgi:hypothetical protein